MIIMRFGENNVFGTIYINFGGFVAVFTHSPYIFCLLSIKTKSTRA